MKVQYHPDFIKKLKTVDVRVRKNFREQIERFQKNHLDPHLDNHAVQKKLYETKTIKVKRI